MLFTLNNHFSFVGTGSAFLFNRNFFSTTLLVVLLLTVLPSKAAESASGWLDTKGKDDAWIAKTEVCRKLLNTVKLDALPMSKYLQSVKERCQNLRKIEKANWKVGGMDSQAVKFLEGCLEDLNKGLDPTLRYSGHDMAYPYWSEVLNRMECIWLRVPKNYDPEKDHQVFYYYKCAISNINYKRPRDKKYKEPRAVWDKDEIFSRMMEPNIDATNTDSDTFHVWSNLHYGARGRMGTDRELIESRLSICRDFPVSPLRVFLGGFSDGGATAIWLASRYPHLVAGVAPDCANWQYGNTEDWGVFNVPFLVVDGWSDGGFKERNFARMIYMYNMSCDVSGLWGQHGHSTMPYKELESFRYIMDWAKTKRLNPDPKRVRYATWNLWWSKAYWFSIERMINPSLAAWVDVNIKEDNRIEVKSKNIAMYKINLNERLVDPKKPVVIITNDIESYNGPFKTELTVEFFKLPESKFYKTPQCFGDITQHNDLADHHGRQWLSVRPTGGSEEDRAVYKNWSRSMIDDDKVTEEHIKNANLIIFGGPLQNKLAAKMAADLPVVFEKGKFTIGKKVYDSPTNVVKFVHPNPLNPDKMVIIDACNDTKIASENNFFSDSGRELFRSSDCVVGGIPTAPGYGLANVGEWSHDYVIFDSTWRAPDETPMGTATNTIPYVSYAIIKAAAMKEATGADVGFASKNPPGGWARWSEGLPKGPINLHDIAVHDLKYPDFIQMGKYTGAQVIEISKTTPGTVVADNKDPLYREGVTLTHADIDPNKIYTVSGMQVSMRIKKEDIEKFFYFNELSEYMGHKALGATTAEAWLSEIEVSEAVAAYFKKHGSVEPPPDVGPHEFIANPEINEWGAFDWVCLSLQKEWANRADKSGLLRRATLCVGLQAEGDGEEMTPRKNSKILQKIALGKTGSEDFWDYAGLDKKLKVKAKLGVKNFSVEGNAEDGFRIAPDKGPGNSSLQLVTISLENTSDQVVNGIALMIPTEKLRPDVGLLPWAVEEGPVPYYAGWYQPALHRWGSKGGDSEVYAEMLLFDGEVPKDHQFKEKFGKSYSKDLIAERRIISIKAGERIGISILFSAFNKIEESEKQTKWLPSKRQSTLTKGGYPNMTQILEEIKPELLK